MFAGLLKMLLVNIKADDSINMIKKTLGCNIGLSLFF